MRGTHDGARVLIRIRPVPSAGNSEVINASRIILSPRGYISVTDGSLAFWAVRFLYEARIVENDAFDQVSRTPCSTHNVRTLDKLLRRHEARALDASCRSDSRRVDHRFRDACRPSEAERASGTFGRGGG